ncbi:MAG: MlaD family protein [Elusimicrobiales bacterium]|nr:MlaD family protein [Elusimicrobiales bacterium]
MKDEIKVGIFTLIGIIIFGGSLLILGDISLEKKYSLYVTFDNIGGLAVKSAVRLNGVEVGKIKNVFFKDQFVVAEISIRESVKIYRDSKFYIASTSIIGSKFLQIEQGNPQTGVLKPYEEVKAITRKPIEDVVLDVAEKLNTLIDELTSKGELAKNINESVKNLRDITVNLNKIISKNSHNIDTITENVAETTQNIKILTSKLENILNKIEQGEGTLGTLISDSKTASELKETVSNIKEATKSLKDFAQKTSKIKISWRWDFKYEPKSKEAFNDVGLKFNVNDYKYYYAGASNIINIKNTPRGISYEPKNTIDAYLGWDYDKWGFYIGAIRSTGGFGLKYKISEFGNNSIYLETEANEFSRNRKIKSRMFNTARYDFGIRYNLNPNISASIKITDILEVKRMLLSTRILFEDKDFAYLLGLTGGSSTALIAK